MGICIASNIQKAIKIETDKKNKKHQHNTIWRHHVLAAEQKNLNVNNTKNKKLIGCFKYYTKIKAF